MRAVGADESNSSRSSRAEKGFPIKKNHVYEIEAVYNNTTDHDVDAMAMMALYFNPEGNRNVNNPGVPGRRKSEQRFRDVR